MMKGNKPILLVEDDRVDAMTVKRALKELHVTNQLDIACNREEALEYLKAKGNAIPCIILLDLNMPKMNGLEFLTIVKQMETYKMAFDMGVDVVSDITELIKKMQ